jgi:hypothetical protein
MDRFHFSAVAVSMASPGPRSVSKEGTPMSRSQRIVGGLGLSILFAAALAAGCSSSTSRESARDQATSATCDRFNQCAPFPSTSYPSAESCELDWRSKWDMAWPAADCDGKIDQSAFELCLAAIHSTACNVFDFLSTLGKCSKQNVCHVTTADGG